MNKRLNDALQLQEKLGRLVHQERELLNEILDLIIMANSSKSFLELGHASLFAWLTVHFKYSESAAKRRIDAARLKKSVPAIEEKIESGAVNLSTVSKAQSAIRAEELRTKRKMTADEKAQVVEKIEGKTGLETEKILMAEFPEAQIFQKERTRVVSQNEYNISIVMTFEEHEFFKRAKELLSHSIPNGSPGKIVAAISKEFVKRNDPLKKKESAKNSAGSQSAGTVVGVAGKVSETGDHNKSDNSGDLPGNASGEKLRAEFSNGRSRHIPNPIRQAVLVRDQHACQSRDDVSGRICGSRYQVEVDHIKPWALGGEHTIENLRCLCAEHNRHRAAQTFGARKK